MSMRLQYAADPSWSINPNPKAQEYPVSNTPNLLRSNCVWGCACVCGGVCVCVCKGEVGGRLYPNNYAHSTHHELTVTCFCKGNRGCRLFLGYIQSTWVDEKWQRHKSPESQAGHSEHVIRPVPGGRVVSLLIPQHTLAMTSFSK